MKTEELKAQGLTQEQINFVMAENGKDIGKIQRELDDMTAERDKEKGRADTAEETLKGFDGVDVEKLNNSIADWKKKAEDAEKDYKQKIADRDFDDLLKESIKSANHMNRNSSVNKGGNNGGGIKSKDDIYATDDKGRFKYTPEQRAQLIADNPGLFQ